MKYSVPCNPYLTLLSDFQWHSKLKIEKFNIIRNTNEILKVIEKNFQIRKMRSWDSGLTNHPVCEILQVDTIRREL